MNILAVLGVSLCFLTVSTFAHLGERTRKYPSPRFAGSSIHEDGNERTDRDEIRPDGNEEWDEETPKDTEISRNTNNRPVLNPTNINEEEIDRRTDNNPRIPTRSRKVNARANIVAFNETGDRNGNDDMPIFPVNTDKENGNRQGNESPRIPERIPKVNTENENGNRQGNESPRIPERIPNVNTENENDNREGNESPRIPERVPKVNTDNGNVGRQGNESQRFPNRTPTINKVNENGDRQGNEEIPVVPGRPFVENSDNENGDREGNAETTSVPDRARRITLKPGVNVDNENGNRQGNEGASGITDRTNSINTQPSTTINISGKSGRVTENPNVITTTVCAGCPIEIHHNDSIIQKYVKNATDIYKERKEIPRNAKVERVYDVKRHVINGIRYDFTVVYGYLVPGSNAKNIAICRVEVQLHHTLPKPSIKAKPCRKPRAGEETDEDLQRPTPRKPIQNLF